MEKEKEIRKIIDLTGNREEKIAPKTDRPRPDVPGGHAGKGRKGKKHSVGRANRMRHAEEKAESEVRRDPEPALETGIPAAIETDETKGTDAESFGEANVPADAGTVSDKQDASAPEEAPAEIRSFWMGPKRRHMRPPPRKNG